MLAAVQSAPSLDTETTRTALTRAFFALTDHWELSREQEAQLLGWTYGDKRTTLDAMRKGKTIISNDADKIDRMIDLVNIHKSLRVLFPYDREAVYAWVKTKRERFGEHSALDVMLEDGKLGIAAIRHYLDHERTR